MHMADALVSTPVAAGAAAISIGLLALASVKVKKDSRSDLLPLMGVMGAFVFASQMINFSIPGTGSSGHIIGGVLLAAMLGPWAGFLVLTSVLIIQCLVFADGGLMALGCNVLNMGAMTTLIAYPFIFRPLMQGHAGQKGGYWRIMGASVLACVVGLELGACLVTAETELSGITALNTRSFLALMTSIHLAIGVGEGLATGAVLCFVQKTRPDLMLYGRNYPISSASSESNSSVSSASKRNMKGILLAFGVSALVLGGIISFFASSDPDGLEWSIARLTGDTELPVTSHAAKAAEGIQQATAVMPDYDSSFAGIIGSVMVLFVVLAVISILKSRKKVAVRNN